MIATAVVIDALQFLFAWSIFIPNIIAFIAFVGFYIWFLLQGVSFTRPKRAFTFFGAALIEIAVPFLDIAPFFTIAVYKTIKDHNKEQATKSL